MRRQRATATEDAAGARHLLVAWVHLAVLWAFAFAQPLFDVLADDPAFFVARGNTAADILLFAFGLVLIPPSLLIAIEALLVRVDRVRRGVHLAFVAVLGAVFALQILADVAPGGSSALLIPLALGCGVVAGFAYLRTRVVPSTLTVLAPTPVVFLALFLLFSDVSKLVLPEDEPGEVQVSVRSETPVVFVVFDELSGLHLLDREGRIDEERYPNFAALARASVWYPNATTVANHTTRAVPAILTGRYPSDGRLPIASDYPDNLFTLLGGSYDLHVSETASHLCPDRLCRRERGAAATRLRSLARDLRIVALRRLLPDDLASDLPAVNRTFGNFQDGAQVVGDAVQGAEKGAPEARGRSFEDFVEEIGEHSRRRSLHFLHILLPHIPWLFLPTGQQYPENGRKIPGLNEEEETWLNSRWASRQAFERYLLQLQYTDRLIGRLVDRLRAVGLYDRSLVVVMADHGVSFRPGDGRRAVTRTNFADLASVPLFIKAPGQTTGEVEPAHVRTVDVLPTVADFLGVDLPWKTDGASLRNRRGAGPGLVRVAPGDAPAIEVPFPAFLRQRDAFASRMLDLFGSGRERSLYAAGAEAGLIGRSTAALPVVRRRDARVELDAAGNFESVDPKGAVVPAFVSGRLVGVPPGQKLAVAVDGRVRAITYSFNDRGQDSFTALVPPAAFRPGANRVHVLAVNGSGAERTLAALGQTAEASFELMEEDGRQLFRSSTGREATVTPGAVAGTVDELDVLPGGVSVKGWAAVPARGPAERILVYVGDRLAAQGAPTEVRDDVAAQHGAATRRSGFVLSGSAPRRGTPSPDQVRVFALFDDRATELDRPPG